MERRKDIVRVFLVLVVSFLVLGFPIYFYCYNLVGVDFRSSDLSFENPDNENPLIDLPNESKILGSNGFSGVFLLARNIFELLPLIGFPSPSLDQNNPTLRC